MNAHDVDLFYAGLCVAALTVVVLSAASGLVKNRLWISEPFVCTCVGALAGPALFNWLPMNVAPGSPDRVFMTEAARVTLAVAIVGAALRLPHRYVRKHWRELAMILGVGMVGMWAVTSAAAAVVLDWALAPALLLGAVLAPTDPVLASPIIAGRLARRHVPESVGNLISMESGSNDGAALALVLLPVAILTQSEPSAVLHEWLVQGVLWEIGIGLTTGGILGSLAGRLHRWARRQHWTEHISLLPLALAVALATLATARLLESDGLLACFIAGLFLNRSFTDGGEPRQESFHHAFSRFFELPFFVLFGAALPWSAWAEGATLFLLFAIAVLALRRLPVWLLMWPALRSLRTRRDLLFAAWFGPIGAAAVFYALDEGGHNGIPDLWPIVSLVVTSSVVAHGFTSTPLTRRMFPDGR